MPLDRWMIDRLIDRKVGRYASLQVSIPLISPKCILLLWLHLSIYERNYRMNLTRVGGPIWSGKRLRKKEELKNLFTEVSLMKYALWKSTGRVLKMALNQNGGWRKSLTLSLSPFKISSCSFLAPPKATMGSGFCPQCRG